MFLLATDDPTTHVRDLILLKAGETPILTTHMVTIVGVAALFVAVMMVAARSIGTGPESQGNDRYLTKGRIVYRER